MSTADSEREFALERTVERVDAYLTAVLAAADVEVERDGSDWLVTWGTGKSTGIEPLDETLRDAAENTIRLVGRSEIRADDGDVDAGLDDAEEAAVELGADEYERTPGGRLVEAILDADAGAAPVGHWRVADGVSDVPAPDWLAGSPVEVTERSFQPYYDRTAVCVGFRASIETVDEFERNVAVPVAVDLESGEPHPQLADWFESITDRPQVAEDRIDVLDGESAPFDRLDGVPSAARTHAESAIAPTVESVRERSTRAANVEFEEYVELQAEKIESLRDERERLSAKLETIAERLEDADTRSERLDVVSDRSELREERDEVVSELERLESKRNEGFPEKRREIQDRHSVQVELTATTVTVVEYEKGDLTLELAEEGRTCSLTVPYGRGVGITGDVTCERCDYTVASADSVHVGDGGVVCESCR